MRETPSGQIAANYAAKMVDSTAEDKQESIDSCVEHLQLMVGKDYWTDEDMSPVNAAITAGLAY